MTTVDQNYSYDELEGFEPCNIKSKVGPSSEIWMSVSGPLVRVSSAARNVLFSRKYLAFYLNEGKKLLLVCSSSSDGPNVIRIPQTGKNALHSSDLRKLLERICRYDLQTVAIRIPGTIARSRKNAVIFDLNNVTTWKPGRKGDA